MRDSRCALKRVRVFVAGSKFSGQMRATWCPVLSAGPIHTRQEALIRLAEVAGFFRRTEPHSPVAYLVQRAIKWGQMPLEVWLQEVIKNDGVLDQLRETLGLNTTGLNTTSGGGNSE